MIFKPIQINDYTQDKNRIFSFIGNGDWTKVLHLKIIYEILPFLKSDENYYIRKDTPR